MRLLSIAAFAAVAPAETRADPGDNPPAREDSRPNDDRGNDKRWKRERGEDRDAQRRGGFRQRDHERAREGAIGRRLLPLEAVLANLGRSYPGHHIGVDGPFQYGARFVYRIKWLTPDGRVIFVVADAESGQILGQRGGR